MGKQSKSVRSKLFISQQSANLTPKSTPAEWLIFRSKFARQPFHFQRPSAPTANASVRLPPLAVQATQVLQDSLPVAYGYSR